MTHYYVESSAGKVNAVQEQNRGQSGQTLMMLSMMLSALIGFMAMVADVGLGFREHANQQQVADSAALAAAIVMFQGGSNEAATNAATAIAAENGYVDGEGDEKVTVQIPPVSGDYAGEDGFAEVIIGGASHTNFASLFGINFYKSTARAVAGGTGTTGAFGIIALNQHQCRAVNLNGNVDIEIQAAGLFVNSDCEDEALWANGNVTVITDVNAVVGGWATVGNVLLDPPPTPSEPISDPLANLPAPTPPTNVMPCPNFQGNPGTKTLSPGRYECTIDPNGPWSVLFQPGNYYITGGVVADGGGNIVFQPGQYTLGGQGLKVTGSGRITVNYALIYVAEGVTELTGNGLTRIMAPTSVPYKGVAIFQARDNAAQLNLKGTAFTSGSGTVYAPAGKVSIVGNATSSNMQFISDTFDMSGSSSLDLVYDGPINVMQSRVRLVE